jgi:hypothetical protein
VLYRAPISTSGFQISSVIGNTVKLKNGIKIPSGFVSLSLTEKLNVTLYLRKSLLLYMRKKYMYVWLDVYEALHMYINCQIMPHLRGSGPI